MLGISEIAPIISGGSLKMVSFARKHKKPVIHIPRENQNPAELLIHFIRSNGIRILNVAGPRTSKKPEVSEFVKRVLDSWRKSVAV